MASLQTTQPTIYSIEPRVFLLRDSTSWQSATNPLNVDMLKIRKGTLVVNSFVDVTTATGGAGTCLFLSETGVTPGSGTTITIQSFDGNATGINRGPDTATGYDPITADGMLVLRKVGTGANAVFSVMAMMVRPNMNP